MNLNTTMNDIKDISKSKIIVELDVETDLGEFIKTLNIELDLKKIGLLNTDYEFTLSKELDKLVRNYGIVSNKVPTAKEIQNLYYQTHNDKRLYIEKI